MKKFMLVLVLVAMGFTYTSCSDDDDTPKAPVITHEHGTESNPDILSPGENMPFTFDVKAEGGFSLFSVTAPDGGKIEKMITAIPIGKEEFTIEGTYLAEDYEYDGRIVLSITDEKGQKAESTIYVKVTN